AARGRRRAWRGPRLGPDWVTSAAAAPAPAGARPPRSARRRPRANFQRQRSRGASLGRLGEGTVLPVSRSHLRAPRSPPAQAQPADPDAGDRRPEAEQREYPDDQIARGTVVEQNVEIPAME